MKQCALASSGPANSFSFSFTCTIVLVSVIISIIIFFEDGDEDEDEDIDLLGDTFARFLVFFLIFSLFPPSLAY